jgi:hypothetical protein
MACDFLFEKKKKHDPSSFLLPIIYPRLLIKNLKIEENAMLSRENETNGNRFLITTRFFRGENISGTIRHDSYFLVV